jgi:hypothetical protein
MLGCCKYKNYDFYFAGKQEHPEFEFQLHNGKTLMKKVYGVESSHGKIIEKRTALSAVDTTVISLSLSLYSLCVAVKALFMF